MSEKERRPDTPKPEAAPDLPSTAPELLAELPPGIVRGLFLFEMEDGSTDVMLVPSSGDGVPSLADCRRMLAEIHDNVRARIVAESVVALLSERGQV